MRRYRLVAVALAATLALPACRIEWDGGGPHGGAPERQLAAATTAADVAGVKQLLAAGADPNKMVEVDGRQQSPWSLALWQVRPRRPELVEIVVAMLKAGASTEAVWGTGTTGPKRTFWQQFRKGGRVGGSGPDNPLRIAMMHPVPEVVRALIDAGLDPRDAQPELAPAVEAGDVEIVHLLVDAGVDVNTTAGAITPLLAAIESRNVALMTYLEDHGAREKP